MEVDNSDSLERILKKDEIVLATNKGWCRVQKNILVKHSQYFEALLSPQHSGAWKENIERKIFFDWLSIETLVFILKFLENPNSCEFKPKQRIFQVAQASDFFNIEPLKLKAGKHYEFTIGGFTDVTRDKVIKVISVVAEADICRLEELRRKCVNWLAKNFAQAWNKPGYVKLNSDLKEEIYQKSVKIVCCFDGKTLIRVQDIEKLKSSLNSNPKSEGSLLAQRLENALKQSVLDGFTAFTDSLIKADSNVSKITWLYDFLGNLLKHVCSSLTVDNICKIYMANESIRNHGMLVKWREETVLRRFSVLDDKCMQFFARNVQLIKVEKQAEWDSLPLMVRVQIDMTHQHKMNASSVEEFSDRGFFFIRLDDKPTYSPPASLLRHTNRPPRVRAVPVPADTFVQKVRSTQRSKSTNRLTNTISSQGRKVQSNCTNAIKVVSKASSVSGRGTGTRRNVAPVKEDLYARRVVREPILEEATAVIPKLSTKLRPSLYKATSFPILSSSSRLPIPTRYLRNTEHQPVQAEAQEKRSLNRDNTEELAPGDSTRNPNKRGELGKLTIE